MYGSGGSCGHTEAALQTSNQFYQLTVWGIRVGLKHNFHIFSESTIHYFKTELVQNTF